MEESEDSPSVKAGVAQITAGTEQTSSSLDRMKEPAVLEPESEITFDDN